MPPVISVEHLSKSYQLGQIGTGTLTNDLQVWWARKRGKPNPLLRIGQSDREQSDGETLWALRDVSFTVEQGEVLGIIGRNGAGKSTLLKVLSRITAPTSGQVKVKGRVASLLEVGTGFHPELTGRENIYLNGAILGMARREIDRKFDEIVDFAEIEKFIDTPVKRFSSGMYVRLAFAVAAHLEPEILLVDEVLAVGDAEFQKKCLGKMGEVADEGRTVLFVSHNMDAIRRLCPKTLLVARGMAEGLGETDEVVEQYTNLTSGHRGNQDDVSYIDCHHLNHSGSGEARIAWAKIQNRMGENTVDIGMDEAFRVVFGVENPLRYALAYAVEIVDQRDYPLIHYWSEFEDVSGDNRQEKQTVAATIPPCNLYPDQYFIHLWIGVHARRLDRIERVFRVSIRKAPEIVQHLLTTKGRYFQRGQWQVAAT